MCAAMLAEACVLQWCVTRVRNSACATHAASNPPPETEAANVSWFCSSSLLSLFPTVQLIPFVFFVSIDFTSSALFLASQAIATGRQTAFSSASLCDANTVLNLLRISDVADFPCMDQGKKTSCPTAIPPILMCALLIVHMTDADVAYYPAARCWRWENLPFVVWLFFVIGIGV